MEAPEDAEEDAAAGAEADAGGDAADAADADKPHEMNQQTVMKPLTSDPYIPNGLLFQWHITDRCNFRCTHCYQETYSREEPDFAALMDILEQFSQLIAGWRTRKRVRAHITLAGGEPFVRGDFPDLLEVFHARRPEFSFAILSNGSLIDAKMARYLKKCRPAFVQISMEGSRENHEKIRGTGSFDMAVSALRHLVREGIRTFISFTAHRENYKDFPQVARIGQKLGVSRVWADRLIPCGSGAQLKELLLTPEETRDFFQIMARTRVHFPRSWFCKTEISLHRALQFLVDGGRPYHCTAGDSLIAVLPGGDLLPCRRMPVPVGNLKKESLAQLYCSSELFQALRDRTRISAGCEQCFYARLCRGGLKCLSHALHGDPFRADPGCWKAWQKTEHGGANPLIVFD
ncbi:MAG: radical SAM protein [Desulfobacterales bacterium]